MKARIAAIVVVGLLSCFAAVGVAQRTPSRDINSLRGLGGATYSVEVDASTTVGPGLTKLDIERGVHSLLNGAGFKEARGSTGDFQFVVRAHANQSQASVAYIMRCEVSQDVTISRDGSQIQTRGATWITREYIQHISADGFRDHFANNLRQSIDAFVEDVKLTNY